MNIREIENRINYSFSNPDLLVTALTHSSYKREHKEVREDNERLEFLGDGILDAVIGLELYRRLKERQEGALTKTRALVVCERSLAEAGLKLGLNEYILFGHGEEHTGGAHKDSIIADAVEAVIGAVLIDGGYQVCERFILDLLTDTVDKAVKGEIFTDYKSEFQELIQKTDKVSEILYVTDREEGPDHDKKFFVHVEVAGRVLGHGTGKTKKEAGQNAAKEAISGLKR